MYQLLLFVSILLVESLDTVKTQNPPLHFVKYVLVEDLQCFSGHVHNHCFRLVRHKVTRGYASSWTAEPIPILVRA